VAGVSGLVGPHILPGPVIDCLIGRWQRRQHGNDSNDSKGKTASVCIPNSYTNRPASLSFSCPCLLIAQDTFARSCIFIFILHPSSFIFMFVLGYLDFVPRTPKRPKQVKDARRLHRRYEINIRSPKPRTRSS